jgi:hypothetical protein
MSDYTITTDFGAKDSLPSGNAAKIIKGSEFTTEFTNIKTAVNTKADTAGDTFTGAVTFDAAVTLNADVTFDTNTMFVDVSANRVGVGTTSPDTSLHVDGGDVKISSDSATSNGDGKPAIFFSESGADEVYAQISYHGDDESGTNNFIGIGCSGAVGTTEALMKENHQMVVKASGNVGIGTSSPSAMLDVELGATGTIAEFRGGDSDILQIKNENDLMVFDTRNTTSGLAFQMQGAERMRIDSSGNVLVGKTSGGALGTAGIELRPNNLYVTSDNSVPIYVNRKTTDGVITDFRKDGTTVGSISVTGSATAYNTSSDERLKENITDSADAGSKVDAIQIRQFDWKADGSHQDYGVIAQELINVAPEAVSEGDTEEDMMGVDYSKLVPMLIKEVQTLRNRVAQLENN